MSILLDLNLLRVGISCLSPSERLILPEFTGYFLRYHFEIFSNGIIPFDFRIHESAFNIYSVDSCVYLRNGECNGKTNSFLQKALESNFFSCDG